MKSPPKRMLSLFTGIGGFDLAARDLGIEVVGACEIDRHARSIYGRHFPDVPIWEDATALDPDGVPDFDLLAAGFPCQSFSIAGKRGGFEDTRGTLFFEIARLASARRPRHLLLENVPGLLSHDEGRTALKIAETLDGLGYDTEWRVLNSADHGVPQHRRRVFIVGHLGGKRGSEILPAGRSGEKPMGAEPAAPGAGQQLSADGADREQRAACLTLNGHRTPGQGNVVVASARVFNPGVEQGHRIWDAAGTLDSGGGAHDRRIWLGPKRQPAIKAINPAAGQAERIYDPDGLSPSVVAIEDRPGKNIIVRTKKPGGGHRPSILDYTPEELYGRLRRLTPVECERLQGFPDGWTEGVAATHRYRCLGNAVTVPVVRHILGLMMMDAAGGDAE